MSRSRVLAIAVAAAFVTAGVRALPASAGRPTQWDHTLTTAHFMIHYHTDLLSGAPAPDYSTETDAGDFASFAEQAYATYRSWGYAAPPPGPDGYIDIYIEDLSTAGVRSDAGWDGAGPGGSSAYFEIATPTQLKTFATSDGVSLTQEEQVTIASNVFYMFELGQWVPTSGGDYWLFYGPGEWAALSSIASAPTSAIGDPSITLDCSDTILGNQMCDPTFYDDVGFARYAFFGMLASKYGNSFLNGVLANGAAGQSGTTALSNALAAKGTSLAAQFTNYVNAYMSGTLGPSQLDAVRPTAFADVTAGVDAITTSTTAAIVPVDHLSARYVTFERGDGDGSHACYAASLTVDVALPSGTSSEPYFFWDQPGSSPQAFSVNGSTASITVPWDTCDWGATRGWVSLPNASTSVDGATFTVTYTMTVDQNTPASATSAPTPATTWGTAVPVPTTDVAPAIEVYAPELLRLSASDPSIRLIVESDGAGTLNAALGTTALGARALRAGNNDLRFVVPKSMLTALRRSALAANVLTLTPVSPAGTVAGPAVTRQVVFTVAKKRPKKHKK